MIAGLRGKRDRMVRGLGAIDGITCPVPAGTFYCFPDISGMLERTGMTCESFAERLLEEAHVAVLAGTAFGPAGTGHLRLCYATDPVQIDLALQRIRAWISSLAVASAPEVPPVRVGLGRLDLPRSGGIFEAPTGSVVICSGLP